MTSPRAKSILNVQSKTLNKNTKEVAKLIVDDIHLNTEKRLSELTFDITKTTDEDLVKEYIKENHVSEIDYVNGFLEIDRLRLKEIEKLKKELSETNSQSSKSTRTMDEVREFYKNKPFKKLLEDAKKIYDEEQNNISQQNKNGRR